MSFLKMNTRFPIERASGSVILSVAFNNDCSYFSVGMDNGLAVYHTKTCMLKTLREFNGGIGLTQMMGISNIIALVGGGRTPKFAHNKLIAWDDSRGKVAMEISALTPVRGAQISRERIFVVLHNSVRVYRFARPPDLLAVYETADNPFGLCVMAESYVAVPGRRAGHVQIIHLASGSVTIITAHTGALRALALSHDGEFLATASETGTLIRIFASSSGARVTELRRGVDSANIFSLAFSPNRTMLACTSDKGTLHVFDLPSPGARRPRPTSPPLPPGSPGSIVNDDASSSSGPTSGSAYGGVEGAPGSGGAGGGGGHGRWGLLGTLGKVPLMPRFLRDEYSFASAPFHVGDEDEDVGNSGVLIDGATLDVRGPPKGAIAWVSDEGLVVIGGGGDARWEKFSIRADLESGRRICQRDAWKRYAGSG